MITYRTTRELIIPAGTEFVSPPTHSTRWPKDFETVLGVDKDHVAYLSIDPQEGLESGFIDEVKNG